MGLTLSDYDLAVESLFARTTGGVRFGLERTLALLEALGNPHERLATFHVAGTNGKGSSVAMLDALLRAKGLRVGRYTSPHLVDFRERILVDGAPIPRDSVVNGVKRLEPFIERLGATFFEVTTVLAFQHFASEGVDVAVIETGLGGRLDSTNVLTPLAAGVTSVSRDHTDLLGDSLEAIAAEKAGIFKRARPAVIGHVSPAILEILTGIARSAAAAPIVSVDSLVRIHDVDVGIGGTTADLELDGDRRRVSTPLVGKHQAENLAFALAMLHAAGGQWRTSLADADRALADLCLPGRMQRVGGYLFDVAHNEDGARVLAETLRLVASPSPMAVVLCVLGDKDWRAILQQLVPVADHLVLTTAPSIPESRAWRIEEVAAHARSVHARVTVEPQLERALALAARDAQTVLVTGSFHTVGDAMACLQVDPVPG